MKFLFLLESESGVWFGVDGVTAPFCDCPTLSSMHVPPCCIGHFLTCEMSKDGDQERFELLFQISALMSGCFANCVLKGLALNPSFQVEK